MSIQYTVACAVCGFAHNRDSVADHPQEKVCVVCQLVKPLVDFPMHTSSFDGHRRSCSACLDAQQAAQQVAQPLVVSRPVHVSRSQPATRIARFVWPTLRGAMPASAAAPASAPLPAPLAALTYYEHFRTKAAVVASAQALTAQGALVLDTETTGLDAARERLVSLSLVRLPTAEMGTEGVGDVVFETRLNPQIPIPARASAVHHLYDRDVADAPTFAQIWPTALHPLLLETPVLIVFNAHFDLGFLAHAVAAAQRVAPDTLPLPPLQVYCAMRMALAWHAGRYRSLSLARACALSGISHTHQHAAVGDALATQALITWYARDVGEN